MIADEKGQLLAAIRSAVEAAGGVRPTRQQFLKSSGFTVGALFRHFPRWSDALAAAGFEFDPYHHKIREEQLLSDWGQLARSLRRIPTRNEYKLEGSYSASVFERNLGSWSTLPQAFREFAAGKPEWSDVVELLPEAPQPKSLVQAGLDSTPTVGPLPRNVRRSDRPTYGDPIDFRGLRHEPVNEDGVVFLFGMVARELGFLVESVQAGFPDCEAKRQVGAGKWQRVRIEFEFESRNFVEHGHAADGCDIIVCWRHNWPECPRELEVVELSRVVRSLPRSDE